MPTDVVMPQMGESIFEGTITKWLKKADSPIWGMTTSVGMNPSLRPRGQNLHTRFLPDYKLQHWNQA